MVISLPSVQEETLIVNCVRGDGRAPQTYNTTRPGRDVCPVSVHGLRLIEVN